MMIRRIFILFISALYHIVRRCIEKTRQIIRQDLPSRVVHLTYHSITAGQQPKFAEQMEELGRIGIAVFADHRPNKSVRKPMIAITFDDGFRCIVDNALPILAEKNIPATIFVTTGYLGKRAEWISDPNHPNFHEVVLSPHDLEMLSADLICIGSHTVSHIRLTTLDESRMMDELINSKKALEKVVKKPIDLLSFPYGAYNKTIETLSQKAGYRHVYSNIPVARREGNDFLIGRINVTLDDWMFEYRLKFLGAYQWLSFAILFKRKLSCFLGSAERHR